MSGRIIMPGQPGTAADRANDERFAQKFFPMIVNLVNAFSAQNPGSAHGVMVAIVTMGARAGKLVGMKRSDWMSFTMQVWDHEERGGFGRGS
jgi:hypothetical protein